MFLLCSLAWAAPLDVADIPNPRSLGGWVADTADVLPADAEHRINTRIDAVRDALGAEVAVVTAHEVAGSPKDFATALLNTWGVGAAHANNGVLMLLVVDARRIEIEVGYGLEAVLSDGATGRLLDRHVLPSFKKGDFAGGLEAGVVAIDAALRADGVTTAEGTGGEVDVGGGTVIPAHAVSDHSTALAWGGGTLGAFGLLFGWMYNEKRRRRCPVCHKEMVKLDEVTEDAHLTSGQVAEEGVGSMDYEVRYCEADQKVVILPHSRWGSGFRKCNGCGHRTMKSGTDTLVVATYDHGGTARVTEDCGHCGFHDTRTVYTPQLQRTTSHRSHRSGGSFGGGGGRSGGSFGGGRSGGGGAGRSF